MFGKKAVIQAVVVALLLGVSVSAVLVSYDWFDSMKATFKTSAESKDMESDFEVKKINKTKLWVENRFEENLKVKGMYLANNTCDMLNINISQGRNSYRYQNCSSNLTVGSVYPVVLETSYGVKGEKEILR